VDWASRKVLTWRVSPTLKSDFCVAALEEALHRFGTPEIFDTDQGAHVTSADFLNVLRARQIQISTDGQGCWRDNVFVERLWRSVRYEEVYLHAYETMSDVRAGLSRYFAFFHQRRPHGGLRRRIPDEVCFDAADLGRDGLWLGSDVVRQVFRARAETKESDGRSRNDTALGENTLKLDASPMHAKGK
jgi:putative transposase